MVEINARQSLVSLFFTRPHFRADVARILHESEDIGRVSQRCLLGRGDANDLLALGRTIHVWSNIKLRIEEEKRLEKSERPRFDQEDWNNIDSLVSRMSTFGALAEKISSAIEDGDLAAGSVEHPDTDVGTILEEPGQATNGGPRFGGGRWMIKPRSVGHILPIRLLKTVCSFSKKIATLHLRLTDLLGERERLELHLQKTYGAFTICRYIPRLIVVRRPFLVASFFSCSWTACTPG